MRTAQESSHERHHMQFCNVSMAATSLHSTSTHQDCSGAVGSILRELNLFRLQQEQRLQVAQAHSPYEQALQQEAAELTREKKQCHVMTEVL